MPSEPRRHTWDEMWLLAAFAVSRRSLCTRDQVGAVVVDARNRIVATGYNGPPAGFDHADRPCTSWCRRAQVSNPEEEFPTAPIAVDYSDCPSLHAEANALMVCDRREREGGKIYVTSGICFTCAKLIANSGLTEVIVVDNPVRSYRDPERTYSFLESCGITVVKA